MGQKLQKRVRTTSTTTYTDYQSGFQYENEVLKFFATAEGYVNVSAGRYNYVYNYTDHLGNIRLSYTKNTLAGNPPVIVEENNYYPFGLKHQGYNNISPPNSVYKYKYNGKEYQDELGLNVYDYGFRNYSPDIGRWINPDPLSEEFYSWSPYNYGLNTPVNAIDPDGRFTLTGIAAQNFVRDLQSQLDKDDNDITVNSEGKITNVIVNDKPHRIFDEKGNQLSLNDYNFDYYRLDNLRKGDRLYHNIDLLKIITMIQKAGVSYSKRLVFGYVGVGIESYLNADFGANQLTKMYDINFNETEYHYDNLAKQRTDGSFYRFGNHTSIYNLADAGNFMWGAWMRANAYSLIEARAGAHLNNFISAILGLGGVGIFDSPEDQRAIKNGYNYLDGLMKK